jgi:hypothetical protein
LTYFLLLVAAFVAIAAVAGYAVVKLFPGSR